MYILYREGRLPNSKTTLAWQFYVKKLTDESKNPRMFTLQETLLCVCVKETYNIIYTP